MCDVMMRDGITYPSAEHAYQAMKTFSRPERHRIASCVTPAMAKRRGQSLELRLDWEEVKLGIMSQVVLRKFKQNESLLALLLSTGDARLVEAKSWHDTFWGVDASTGEGQHWLGIILMLRIPRSSMFKSVHSSEWQRMK